MTNSEGPQWLTVIPARGGSKGLPGKNIRPLQGKPLIGWTIEAALAAGVPGPVVVSSDDEAILAVARQFGAIALRRPDELATDTATSVSVVDHALSLYPDVRGIMLLQPTSPLRGVEHIRAAMARYQELGRSSLVSVCAAPVHPYLCFEPEGDGGLRRYSAGAPTRRQDMPPAVTLNGAIYLISAEKFRAGQGFLFPDTGFYDMAAAASVDIDDIHDFRYCEFLLANA